MMFDPDAFTHDPYGAGTNQLGHVTLGAAIAGALVLSVGVAWGVWAASALVVLWEVWQRAFRGATLLDMKADVFYWLSGVASWGVISWVASLPWWAALWPWVPCVAFMLEYWRISNVERNV